MWSTAQNACISLQHYLQRDLPAHRTRALDAVRSYHSMVSLDMYAECEVLAYRANDVQVALQEWEQSVAERVTFHKEPLASAAASAVAAVERAAAKGDSEKVERGALFADVVQQLLQIIRAVEYDTLLRRRQWALYLADMARSVQEVERVVELDSQLDPPGAIRVVSELVKRCQHVKS
jgi:hypothetical protein